MRWLDRKEQTEGLRHEQETADRDKDASALNARMQMIGQASDPMEDGGRVLQELEGDGAEAQFPTPCCCKVFFGVASNWSAA